MSVPCHQCDYFSGFLAEGFIVCAIHPSGPVQDPCPDFVEVVEDWKPLGAIYEGDELIKGFRVDRTLAALSGYLEVTDE